MLMTGILFLGMAHSREKPAVLREWKKARGKIIDSDEYNFKIEYEYSGQVHFYDCRKDEFYLLMGYTPHTVPTAEMAVWAEKQRNIMNRLMRKGYTRDYFFRLCVGKRMLVWCDGDSPEKVYRVWSTDKAERSVARAFRTIGIALIILTVLAAYSEISGNR